MIIGVCGLIGSGKGTVADILVEEHNFKKISFADKLKDSVAVLFGWPRSMLEGDTQESRQWREQVDEFWTNETGRTVTPRLVLQEFGTECMRQGFYDGIWVSIVKQQILTDPYTNWVIPDTRFPNEIAMLQEIGGQVWCVTRGETPQWFLDYRENNIKPADIHASEWAWGQTRFDEEIANDGTLEELRNQVSGLLASNVHLLSV
jgi:hypothetical protein